jgi:hypothetical protein
MLTSTVHQPTRSSSGRRTGSGSSACCSPAIRSMAPGRYEELFVPPLRLLPTIIAEARLRRQACASAHITGHRFWAIEGMRHSARSRLTAVKPEFSSRKRLRPRRGARRARPMDRCRRRWYGWGHGEHERTSARGRASACGLDQRPRDRRDSAIQRDGGGRHCQAAETAEWGRAALD